MSYKTKTSPLVASQVPDFVRGDFPTFIKFLESYYEFLELSGPPIALDLLVQNPGYLVDRNGFDILTYGTPFQVGELLHQYADSETDIPTGIGTVYDYVISPDGNVITLILNKISGTDSRFVATRSTNDNALLYGQTSGAIAVCSETVYKAPAGAINAMKSLLDYQDIDLTLDDYLSFLKKEYAASFPLELAGTADKVKAIKNLRDFYRSRGTENSFKFLFRIFFDEDVELIYPETKMLRASGRRRDQYPTNYNHWNAPSVLRIDPIGLVGTAESGLSTQTIDPAKLLSRKVFGLVSGATATVESAISSSLAGSDFIQLTLSADRVGQFLYNETIETDDANNPADGTKIAATISGLVHNININNGGSNFKVGDPVTISGGKGGTAKVSVVGSSGEIREVEITQPGIGYTTTPDITAHGIHTKDRFEEGPTETIFYDDFSAYRPVTIRRNNTPVPVIRASTRFYSVDDNRGPDSALPGGYSSNTQITNDTNLVPVPTLELKAHWKMNGWAGKAEEKGLPLLLRSQYPLGYYTVPEDLRVIPNGLTGSALTTVSKVAAAFLGDGSYYPNSTFIQDSTGHGHHAVAANFNMNQLQRLPVDRRVVGTSNDFVSGMANSVTTSNISLSMVSVSSANIARGGTGWPVGDSPTSGANAEFASGSIGLMSHDEIEEDDQQTWAFWYKPTANIQHNATIISRYAYFDIKVWNPDRSGSLSGGFTSPYQSLNAVPGYYWTSAKYANTTTHGRSIGLADLNITSRMAGAANAEPRSVTTLEAALRQNVWHLMAITEDYKNHKGYFRIHYGDDTEPVYRTWDIDVSANASFSNGYQSQGYSNPTGVYAYNVGRTLNPGIDRYANTRPMTASVHLAGLGQSGDKNVQYTPWAMTNFYQSGGAPGLYDEVSYYNRTLANNEIEALFRNPNRYRPISGKWFVSGYSDVSNVTFTRSETEARKTKASCQYSKAFFDSY